MPKFLCGAIIVALAAATVLFATLFLLAPAPEGPAQLLASVDGVWLRSGDKHLFNVTERTFDLDGLFGFAEGLAKWPPLGLPGSTHAPRYVKAGQSMSIKDEEYVVGVLRGGEAFAYPLKVLEVHQVVNDAKVPSPMFVYFGVNSRTAAAYGTDAQPGAPLAFGCTGYLMKNVDLLYDASTESLFSPLEGRFVAGKRIGQTLPLLPSAVMRLAEWRSLYPDTWLMTENTGAAGVTYRARPAPFDEPVRFKTPLRLRADLRMAADAPVLVLRSGWRSAIVPLTPATPGVFAFEFEGQKLTAHFDRLTKAARVTGADGSLYPAARSLWLPAMATLPDARVILPEK